MTLYIYELEDGPAQSLEGPSPQDLRDWSYRRGLLDVLRVKDTPEGLQVDRLVSDNGTFLPLATREEVQ